VLALLLAALALPATASHAAPVGFESSSLVTSDGVRLHVIEEGQGRAGQPVIAFVPGWSMPASVWAKQIAALSATHKVVALDPRGQGESEIPAGGYTTERRAEDIRDLISRYGPVVLVTWSLGSLEALQYVHKHGESGLRALVIVDSSVGEMSAAVSVPSPRKPPPAPGPQPSFQDELRLDRPKAIEQFLRAIFRTPQADRTIATLRDAALRMPLEASLSIFPGDRIPRERWRRTVNAFRKPLLYAVTPQYAAQARRLKANRPATRVEIFENAGHALFVDEPERFNTVLIEFLRSNNLM
jgi:microsomal epoxide hydrolase